MRYVCASKVRDKAALTWNLSHFTVEFSSYKLFSFLWYPFDIHSCGCNIMMTGKPEREDSSKEKKQFPIHLKREPDWWKTIQPKCDITNKDRIWRLYCCCICKMSLDAACDSKEETGRGKPHRATYCSYICKDTRSWLPIHVEFPEFCPCYAPFNVSQSRKAALDSFILMTLKTINPTLKLCIKQDTSSNTLLFLHVISFLDAPPLSSSLRLPQLCWRDREEIHVPGKVFVRNRSADAAAVAGISITSVGPFLPCMDQLPVSG